MRVSEKSFITNKNLGSRQCAFHRHVDDPCALP